jgi:cytochrome P450
MGNALARLEARTAFDAIARRFPDIRIDEGGLEWRPNPLMRRIAELPVSVRPVGVGAR